MPQRRVGDVWRELPRRSPRPCNVRQPPSSRFFEIEPAAGISASSRLCAPRLIHLAASTTDEDPAVVTDLLVMPARLAGTCVAPRYRARPAAPDRYRAVPPFHGSPAIAVSPSSVTSTRKSAAVGATGTTRTAFSMSVLVVSAPIRARRRPRGSGFGRSALEHRAEGIVAERTVRRHRHRPLGAAPALIVPCARPKRGLTSRTLITPGCRTQDRCPTAVLPPDALKCTSSPRRRRRRDQENRARIWARFARLIPVPKSPGECPSFSRARIGRLAVLFRFALHEISPQLSPRIGVSGRIHSRPRPSCRADYRVVGAMTTRHRRQPRAGFER